MNAIWEQINSAGLIFVEFALPMFVQSGVLILILLLADFALRKKVRAIFRYWIWMLVLVKLILPTSLSAPLSLGYFFGNQLAYVDGTETTTETAQTAPAIVSPMIDPPRTEAGSDTSAIAPTTPTIEPAVTGPLSPPIVPVVPLSWQGVVFLLWLTVVMAMGLLLLQRAIFVRGLVAQAKEANSMMDDTLESCCERMGVKRKIGLKVSANATSPAVCGLFRPVILVPQNLMSSLSPSQLRAVLLHELAHIRRGDLWVNLAQTLLQIIYFYNPLLWLANAVIRRVREQAVDEMVLVAMGEKARQYPQTLVNVAKLAFKRPALSLRLIGVVESKSALAGRIKHILNRPMPKKAKLGILGLAVVIITAAILLPMAKSMPGPPELIIKGMVKDAQTGEPIAGARVFDDGYGPKPNWEQIKADERSEWGAITNSAGEYSFLTWPEHHSIKVEAPGYKAKQESLYDGHFVFNKKEEETFDFALESEKASEPSGFRKTLPNGVTVELIGVCEHPSQGKQWWRPNGKENDFRPYRFERFRRMRLPSNQQENKILELAIKVTSVSERNIGLICDGAHTVFTNCRDTIWGNTIEVNKSVEEKDLRLGISTEPWKSVAISGARFGGRRRSTPDFAFTEASDTEKGYAVVTITHKKDIHKDNYRVVAIDREGNLHVADLYQDQEISGLKQSTVHFKGLKSNQIRRFEFQTRPYEWIEFKNVSLKPGVKTDVQVEEEDEILKRFFNQIDREIRKLKNLYPQLADWNTEKTDAKGVSTGKEISENRLIYNHDVFPGRSPGYKDWCGENGCHIQIARYTGAEGPYMKTRIFPLKKGTMFSVIARVITGNPEVLELEQKINEIIHLATASAVQESDLQVEPGLAQLRAAFEAQKFAHSRDGFIALVQEIGNKEPESFLIEQLESDNRARRCQAALALEILGDRRGIPAIVRELNDTSYRPTTKIRSDSGQDQKGQIRQDHYYAALLLGISGDKRAVLALIEATRDEEINYQAAISLGQIGDMRAVPALRAMLEKYSNEPFVRLFAGYGLAMLNDEEGLRVVIDTLNNQELHWVDRRHAIRALGALRDKQAVPHLIVALKDDHPNIRVSAARALGAIGDASALLALEQALTDKTETKANTPTTVSKAAAEAIAQIRAEGRKAAMQIEGEEGWGEVVEGLRVRWVHPNEPIVRGTAPVLTMEVENVSSKQIIWECSSGFTWGLNVHGVSPANTLTMPKFRVQVGSDASPEYPGGKTGPEPQPTDHYKLEPEGRIRLSCALPWVLPDSGQYTVNGVVWRRKSKTESLKMGCSSLVLNVVNPTSASDKLAYWGAADTLTGLQLGLSFDLQARPYRQGEVISFKAHVRNTGDKIINLVHFGLREWLPTILDSHGKAVSVTSLRINGSAQKRKLSLSPGETKPVGTIFLNIDSEPKLDSKGPNPHCYLTPGTYYIQQKFAFREDAEANWFGELTTGKLMIEILPDEKSDVQVEGEKPQSLIFHGLDLTAVPHTTNSSKLPDLFEERPLGSKSYHIQKDVTAIYSGFDGTVYFIPRRNILYVQHDKLGSSTLTYYGPFEGNPVQILNLQEDVQVEFGSNAPISEAGKENKKPQDPNEPSYDGRSLTELIAALGDQDFQTRINAVYHLGYMGPKAKPAVPALVDALDEESLRESVLHSLGNIGVGAEEAIPALIKAIAEYAPACRWMAAESLAKIGNAAVPPLKKAAGSEEIYLRIWCNAALAKQQGTDSPSLRYLAQLMKNADKRTAGEVVSALTMLGPISKPLVPDLIEALKHSVVPKKHIASALARIGKDARPAVPELTKMLQDTDLGTRADAIYALSRIGGPDIAPAVPLLIQALKTNDTSNTAMASRVRYTAATALGNVGPDARPAIPALVIALDDKNEFVRANSAKAIGDIDPTDLQAVPALIEAMKDESGRVRVAAAQTLLKIGPVNKEVILAFIEAANDNWKGVSNACDTFFTYLGPQHSYVIPDLIGMLKTPNERAQRLAIRALGNMGEAAAPAVPYIIESMKNSRLEGIASGALRKLGPKAKAAVPELIKMLGDKRKRFSAALVLEAIGPQAREAIPALQDCLGDKSRVTFARALLAINPKSGKAIQQLVRVAESTYVPDQWTEQPDAHYLLVKYGHNEKKHLHGLIDALENPNSRIRLSAAAYLGKLGAKANEATESLRRALKDDDPEVRAEAAHAILLISLKPSERKEACNILVDLLDGKDFASHDGLFMAQVRAAEALLSFGPLEEWTVPLLIAKVQDGSMRTRVAAIKAFGNIGPGAKEALPYLKRLLKDEDWQIRHSAAQAIEKIDNKHDV